MKHSLAPSCLHTAWAVGSESASATAQLLAEGCDEGCQGFREGGPRLAFLKLSVIKTTEFWLLLSMRSISQLFLLQCKILECKIQGFS